MKNNYEDLLADVADMTQMSIQNLTNMRRRLRRHEDVVALLDEQTALLMRNAELARRLEDLKLRVRRGEITDYVAAFMCGGISMAAKENRAVISLNSRIIEMLLHTKRTGRRIEA